MNAKPLLRDDNSILRAPDRAFDRQMILARLRWNLCKEAEAVVADLNRQSIPIDVGTIEIMLAKRVSEVRPRSVIVPWHVSEQIVDRMIHVVAVDVAEAAQAA